jgi:hypothetical protein
LFFLEKVIECFLDKIKREVEKNIFWEKEKYDIFAVTFSGLVQSILTDKPGGFGVD